MTTVDGQLNQLLPAGWNIGIEIFFFDVSKPLIRQTIQGSLYSATGEVAQNGLDELQTAISLPRSQPS